MHALGAEAMGSKCWKRWVTMPCCDAKRVPPTQVQVPSTMPLKKLLESFAAKHRVPRRYQPPPIPALFSYHPPRPQQTHIIPCFLLHDQYVVHHI